MLPRSLLSFAALLALVSASGARAFTTTYPDCAPGTTVQYTDIAESNAGATALYNAPNCVGDQIDFNPTGFVANASPSANPDQIDGNLLFTVNGLTNYTIDNIVLDESGDQQVFGFPPSNTIATATLTVRLEILIGVTLLPDYVRQATYTQTASPTATSPGVWTLHEEFVIATILGEACTGTGFYAGLPIAAACGATTAQVGVNIDNTLFAYEESGELAFINKKDFQGLTITTNSDPVPEPGTAALVGIGLLGLGIARRRSA